MKKDWRGEMATRLFGERRRESKRRSALDEDQHESMERASATLERFGGVLICDPVGSGKTRIALTLAEDRTRRSPRGTVWICAPARVRSHWRAEIAALVPALKFEFLTHHALSRGMVPDGAPDIVVVDEAHRFRNRTAKRTQTLRAICRSVPTVLMTATPVVNREDDVRALVELFIDSQELRRTLGFDLDHILVEPDAFVALIHLLVVRRPSHERPNVRIVQTRYETSDVERWLWRTLGDSLREMSWDAFGESFPVALFIDHLVRRFEWGVPALRESVVEVQHFLTQWLICADQGTTIDRAMFRSLFRDEQQVLPFLYPTVGRPDRDVVERVRSDRLAFQTIVQQLDETRGAAIDALTRLLPEHDPLLVFASQVATASATFRAVSDAGYSVGLVTGGTAEISGVGRVPAEEVLSHFKRSGPRHRRIQVLVATDCLSEGVSLSVCQNVALLDTPHTPLAIEQRIGRIVRRDSGFVTVNVFTFVPSDWSQSLGMRQRLNTKAERAKRLGFSFDLLGSHTRELESFFELQTLRQRERVDLPTRFLVLTETECVAVAICSISDGELSMPVALTLSESGDVTVGGWAHAARGLTCADVATERPQIDRAFEAILTRMIAARNAVKFSPQVVLGESPISMFEGEVVAVLYGRSDCRELSASTTERDGKEEDKEHRTG